MSFTDPLAPPTDEVARLKRNLALTTFLLEHATDSALDALDEVETLTYQLEAVRAELGESQTLVDILINGV